MTENDIRRFWGFVQKTDACWLWTGAKQAKGYGAVRMHGGARAAHRVAWEIHHGAPPPPRVFICHHCDTPSCVNPAHLFLGDVHVNNADMKAKGRNARGSRHNFAKLDEATVLSIRADWATGAVLQKDLAKKYGVCRPLVSLIVRRKIWTHI